MNPNKIKPDYLEHAQNFLNQWDALKEDPTANEDDFAKVLYDDWIILPTSTIGDHINLRLLEEGYVSGGPEKESRKLIVVATNDFLEDSNVKTPRISLEDMIVECFRYVGGQWETAEEIEEVIRRAVEAGISRGMREFDVDGVTIPRGMSEVHRGFDGEQVWPAIHAAEYESRPDPLGRSVFAAARLSVDCDDCDLNGSLEALERLLRGKDYSNEERLKAEESVEASLEIIQNAFEDRDKREVMRDHYGIDD
jgi:hypothetical protein